MLEQVRRKAAEMGQEGRARFVQADVQEMDELETGAYALATAFGEPVGSAARPAKALREIRRILADDGVLVATFDNRLAGIEYYLESGDTTELQSFLRSGRTHWLTRARKERFELHTFTPRQVRALLEKAGFAVLSVVGKTVLPMRAYRTLLEDGPTARRLMRIEKQLARDEDAIGRAPHIQAAARAAKSR
jgi:ubiquinone/menaquinone biosynthesis C-methylase UbiE